MSLNLCGLTDGVCVQLPPSFRSREHAQDQLLSALLAREGARPTAVTAPKSRISSQGMGGVGKTMLTAAGTAYVYPHPYLLLPVFTHYCYCHIAVVRDERLRASFKVDKRHIRSTELIRVLARVLDDLLVEPKSAA